MIIYELIQPIIFDIIIDPKKKIKGEYWTGRKTTGQIELEFWRKKGMDEYPKEIGSHPVSKIRKTQASLQRFVSS